MDVPHCGPMQGYPEKEGPENNDNTHDPAPEESVADHTVLSLLCRFGLSPTGPKTVLITWWYH